MTRFFTGNSLSRRTLCAAVALFAAGAARAAEAPAPSATENLVRALVKSGQISAEAGEALISQARAEAEAARLAAAPKPEVPTEPAPAPVPHAAPNGDKPPADGVVRVQYVPESVKQQLRDDIRQEVMARAKAEGWAAPGSVPEWVSRLHPAGDLRLRYELRQYPEGNDITGSFPNFNALNLGAPYDISASNPNFAPQTNADQARERIRMRSRFGFEVDLGEDFTAGIRFATGDTNTPVSQNQTFGQTGGFSKYAIWIDRAYLKYEPTHRPGQEISAVIGRFDNPFFATSLLWSDYIGFDGACAKVKYNGGSKIAPFLVAGAFPVGNTELDFSSLRPAKIESRDKWLYAAQLGVDLKPAEDYSVKIAGAFYSFENVSGEVSTPYTPLSAQDAGDTDDSRPGFAQKGNTYMPLRNILPDASNAFGTTNQWQYFGLAPEYRVAAFTARADYDGFESLRVSLLGEVIKNIAFDKGAVGARAINNRENDAFAGGDLGWTVELSVGTPALEKRWDWLVAVGYRHEESDAMIDGFNETDFGNGGTNVEGVTLTGSLALSKRVWLRARWISAESVAGPTFRADTLQFDINARF